MGKKMDTEQKNLKEAVLWESAGQGKVQCNLCSWRCVIADGKVGRCAVRKNQAGVLYSLNYDKVCAANVDPIEKKPLFHFQPGSQSFSVAAIGCNFRCDFCQNWQISQMALDSGQISGEVITPEQIVQSAIRGKCSSIAYTYTEPTVFMELTDECGRLAKQNDISNVFVSNGFMTKEAVDFATNWLDGINIDLKAFSENYYKKLCKAKLAPVLETIKYIAESTDIWMELTTLLVPGENDSDDELKALTDFIVSSAGVDTPWHVSRFHPNYKYQGSVATPADTLERAMQIGKDAGLHFIYVGNLPGAEAESTFCYKCSKLLIERFGYNINENYIENSKCPDCGAEIAGVEL